MKLLLCSECGAIFSLSLVEKECDCGKVRGSYLDDERAIYYGDTAVPIGLSSPELRVAMKGQREAGPGVEFKAFVIPAHARNFVRMK